MYTGFWWGNLRERDHWGDLGANGRVILRWIFRKWDEGAWTELILTRIRKIADTCICGNDSSGFIKCGEFLDCQRTS